MMKLEVFKRGWSMRVGPLLLEKEKMSLSKDGWREVAQYFHPFHHYISEQKVGDWTPGAPPLPLML